MELAGPTRSWTKDENGKFIGYRLHTWRTTEVWAKSLCAASKVSNYHNGMARVDVTPPKFVWRCVHLALYLVVAILVTFDHVVASGRSVDSISVGFSICLVDTYVLTGFWCK